ncbi:Long-chain-fatty-acid--coa ligase acsbg2, partial [Globisporangium splendens]
MDKRSRDGGFSDPSFVSVGDPYMTKKSKDRGLGGDLKPFLTCPPKKGQTAATLGPGFRKFDGIGGECVELYKLEAKRRLENTSKFVKSSGFAFSSPPKAQYVCGHDVTFAGAGDYCGAFAKFERDEDDIKKAQEENAARPRPNPKDRAFEVHSIRQPLQCSEKKNVLTNPGKRGTFGYTGTLIGGQIPAVPIEFDSERIESRKDLATHRALMCDRKAFKFTATSVDYFDAHEHVAAAKVLRWDDTCIVKPPGALELMNPKERAAAKASTFKPWRPNNPSKEGDQGLYGLQPCYGDSAFEKFTEQQPDPYDESVINRAMLPNRRHLVKVTTKNLPDALKERKAFRPSSFPKSKLTKGTCLLGISKHHL